jgi:hypothetical protein
MRFKKNRNPIYTGFFIAEQGAQSGITVRAELNVRTNRVDIQIGPLP